VCRQGWRTLPKSIVSTIIKVLMEPIFLTPVFHRLLYTTILRTIVHFFVLPFHIIFKFPVDADIFYPPLPICPRLPISPSTGHRFFPNKALLSAFQIRYHRNMSHILLLPTGSPDNIPRQDPHEEHPLCYP